MWRIIRALLNVLPSRAKSWLLKSAARFSARRGSQIYHNIYRLPGNLVLKTTTDMTINESYALRFVESIEGVYAPHLIGCVSGSDLSYIVMTWIDGDCCQQVWDALTPSDKARIVRELRTQIACLREHTIGRHQLITAASGASISDPRIPWLREEPELIASSPRFFKEVWIGLDLPANANTIRPAIQPLADRTDIPVVFCHGDLLPRNLILPGGLEKWRAGSTPVAIIDWEYAGWMPLPWEALKATWLIVDPDEDEWYDLMKEVFPESLAELEADWLWRSQSGIPIL